MKFILSLLILSTHTFANDFEKAPLSFSFKGSRAVFSDFKQADYHISYDVLKKEAQVQAQIKLETQEAGYIVFDLHNNPKEVFINGIATSADVHQSPDKETSWRIVNHPVGVGEHTLSITVPLTQLVEWDGKNVRSAFWMSDLTDRGYIERYIPTNLIYDRFPMTFYVKFNGIQKQQIIYANAKQEVLADGTIKLSYRDNFNTTCQYFHTVPEGAMKEEKFNYTSIDGRNIPVVVYVPNKGLAPAKILERTKRNTLNIMSELEKDYGPFLHPDLTIYINGQGGMEYSGATMTSESALGHELFHSYFARGVMPSNGNAGWIDEALASWRDEGYQRTSKLNGSTSMAAHGPYTRASDRNAYSFGERFMAYMDNLVKDQGGLKPFLKTLVDYDAFKPHTTEDFIQSMNKYYQKSFDAEFNKYIYGKKEKGISKNLSLNHHIHRQHSLEELQNML